MGDDASRRATNQANDRFDWGTGHGMQRLLNSLYGSGSVWQGDLSSITRNPDGSYTTGQRPTYGADGILGRLQGVANNFRTQAGGIQSGFDADTRNLIGAQAGRTNQLDAMAAGAEGMAKQWGRGRSTVIRNDFAQGLKDANRMGDAALAAGGFNSATIRANQYGGNARTMQREQQRALQDNSDAMIGQQLGARNNRLNMMTGRLGEADTLGAQRASQGTTLRTGLLNQQMGFDTAPLQTEMQAMQSSIMNPYLGQSSYQPGQSALGNALSQGGNTLAGLAAYQYSRNQNRGQGGSQQGMVW